MKNEQAMQAGGKPSATHWSAPRWVLALLIAGLSTVGPFTVDTYLPAFSGISQSLDATPLQMQQTLSSYLFGFGVMMLFHGALADSFGRKPVIMSGLAIFTLTSVGCMLSQSIHMLIAFRMLQGMSAGAGMVVSRAMLRDLFDATTAQKVMSQVTIFFGIAPAIAPLIGGYLFVHVGWRSIFGFLVILGIVLMGMVWRALPETLSADKRHTFAPRPLLHGYREVGLDLRFLLLAVATGVPFNAMFLYVLSAPAFLTEQMGLKPTEFFGFFIVTITGIMSGAFVSGRVAGRWQPHRQINAGFTVMALACLMNLLYSLSFKASYPWAVLPLWFVAFGWALLAPAVTMKVMDTFPKRLGMASSLAAFVAGCVNALTAGVLAPLVMHSALALSIASLLLMATGFVSWRMWRRLTR